MNMRIKKNSYNSKKFKYLFAFIVMLLIAMLIMPALDIHPVHGDSGKDIKDNGQKWKAGDTKVVKGGYVATFIEYTSDRKEKWTVTFGIPEYLDDLKTKIDTQWHLQGDGSYKSGNNKFSSNVVNEEVELKENQNKESIKWKPSLVISKGNWDGNDWILNSSNTKAELIAVDPLNSNYKKNTLVWHYDNGIDRFLRLTEGQCQEYFVINNELKNDLIITPNAVESNGFKAYKKAVAYDSLSSSIKLEENNKVVTLRADKVKKSNIVSQDKKEIGTIKEINEVKYPIIIDPNYDFTTSASDGWIQSSISGFTSSAAAWSNAYSSAGNIYNATNYALVDVDTWRSGASYSSYTSKSFVYFDTSSLYAGLVITNATLSLYGNYKSTTLSAWTLAVQSGQPTYPHDPMVSADFAPASYGAGNGGTLASGAMATGSYNVITLNATGIGYINKGGLTKLTLRDNTNDIPNTTPAFINDGVTRYNYFGFYTYEQGVGYQPYLTVTYTISAPTVTTVAASNITSTTSQLNSTIDSDGGDPSGCVVTFGWGTVSVGSSFVSYPITSALPITYFTGETPLLSVSSLVPNTTYYYNVQITNNSGGNVALGIEGSFTTLTGLSSITNTGNAYPSDTTVSLNWTPASGSTSTNIYVQNTPYANKSPYLIDNTGTATGSPITLVYGENTITVTADGTFNSFGVIGTATSGSSAVDGSPLTLTGENDLITITGNGTFTINVTSINQNPNALYNYSFEVTDPPDGWTLAGAGASVARTNAKSKLGTYSASLTRAGANATLYQDLLRPAPYSGVAIGVGVWAWSSVANTTSIRVNDDGGSTTSTAHPGDSTWRFLNVYRVVINPTTTLRVTLAVSTTDTVSYFDDAIAIYGGVIPATGTLIYPPIGSTGTGSNYTYTGLTPGTTYYFALFGVSAAGIYSTNGQYLTVTTTAYANNGDAIGTPTAPSRWLQIPTGTKLSNITPFYQVTENLRTSVGMPQGMFYLGITFMIMIVAFMAVLFMTGSGVGGMVGMFFVLLIGVVLGTVPLVAGFIILVIGIALLMMMRGL